jgi:hypothetical protein
MCRRRRAGAARAPDSPSKRRDWSRHLTLPGFPLAHAGTDPRPHGRTAATSQVCRIAAKSPDALASCGGLLRRGIDLADICGRTPGHWRSRAVGRYRLEVVEGWALAIVAGSEFDPRDSRERGAPLTTWAALLIPDRRALVFRGGSSSPTRRGSASLSSRTLLFSSPDVLHALRAHSRTVSTHSRASATMARGPLGASRYFGRVHYTVRGSESAHIRCR